MPLAIGEPYGIGPAAPEPVSTVTATNSVALGTIRYEGGSLYQYVYNAGGEVIYKGYACILSATTGYSVTVSSLTDPWCRPFGVCAHTTSTTGTYFWALRRGYATLIASAKAITAGVAVFVGTNGTFMPNSAVTLTSGMKGCCGLALGTTAAAGSFAAYVNCA
jgi:hypothetical protein